MAFALVIDVLAVHIGLMAAIRRVHVFMVLQCAGALFGKRHGIQSGTRRFLQGILRLGLPKSMRLKSGGTVKPEIKPQS